MALDMLYNHVLYMCMMYHRCVSAIKFGQHLIIFILKKISNSKNINKNKMVSSSLNLDYSTKFQDSLSLSSPDINVNQNLMHHL